MPAFRYQAYDLRGDLAQGIIEASSRNDASEALLSQGLTAFGLQVADQAAVPWWQREVLSPRRSSRSDVAAFTMEFATLLGAEIPLADALRILVDQVTSPGMRALVTSLHADVLNGTALSDAMQRRGHAFPPDYVSIVRAGEVGGTLGRVLGELADLLERRLELRAKVQSALVYPAILIAMSILTLSIVVGVLLPSIASAFAESGRPLPGTVRVLAAVQSHWVGVVVALGSAIALCAGIAAAMLRQPRVALLLDGLKLRLPALGPLVLNHETARFGRTLGTLVRSGVPLLQASTAAAEVVTNRHLRAGLERAIALIREGSSLHRALETTTGAPQLALRMISVGEEAGKLDQMLLRVAATFEQRTQHSIDRLMTLLTPILTLTMAGLVGALIMTVMSAVLSINELAVQ